MEEQFKTRRIIIDSLIKTYTTIKFLENDYPQKTRFLSKKLNCKCTDCGGQNSISSCNLEDKYYKKIN